MKKNHIFIMPFLLLLISLFIANCGSGPDSPGNSMNLLNGGNTPVTTSIPGSTATPQATGYTYEAVEYTITDSSGKEVILRSRGSGNKTSGGYFDVYIQDGASQTTAFKNDPIWYTYPMSIKEALQQTDVNNYKTGSLIGTGTTNEGNYFLDMNGGSDMGGLTYEFHTGPIVSSSSNETHRRTIASKSSQARKVITKILFIGCGTTVIHIEIEEGGNVIVGNSTTPANMNGAIFWNGTKWVTNDTAAHMYFTDDRTGERLKNYTFTNIDSTAAVLGNVLTVNGYNVKKNLYTYTVPKDGKGPEHTSNCYITSFEFKYTDSLGQLQSIVILPVIGKETIVN